MYFVFIEHLYFPILSTYHDWRGWYGGYYCGGYASVLLAVCLDVSVMVGSW